MRFLSKKNFIGSGILISIVLLVFFIDFQMHQALLVPAYFTGWTMFFIMSILLLFNLRKKISFLPLGSVYKWTQLHVYGGALLFIIFIVHIAFTVPGGVFETLLSVLFLIVSVSGIYGGYISRRLPARIMQQPDYVIYERIPGIRDRIFEEVELRVNTSIDEMKSVAIAEFYSKHLYGYLSQSKDFWRHIISSEHVYSQWQNHFNALRMYLNDSEKAQLDEIEDLTRRKTDLDSQYTYRSLLKYWLFLHIPFSYILFITVIIHLLLVYGFSETGL